MEILKIIETLQSYSEDVVKYKLDGAFAGAVTEAVALLVAQGEKIVDLEQELAAVKSDREYFRSRAAFFGEVAGVTDKVISVEGYKAFRGTMKIQPKTAAVSAFELSSDWLYKPDTGCWYGKGSSFAADICTIVEVKQ